MTLLSDIIIQKHISFIRDYPPAGWPDDVEKLPFDHLTLEHRDIMTKKCSNGKQEFPLISYHPPEAEESKRYVTKPQIFLSCLEKECSYVCCEACRDKLIIKVEKKNQGRSTRKKRKGNDNEELPTPTDGACHEENPYTLKQENGRSYFTMGQMIAHNREKCHGCKLWFKSIE